MIRDRPDFQRLQLVNLEGAKLSLSDAEHFYAFYACLINAYKAGNLVLTYRGESVQNLYNKLFAKLPKISRPHPDIYDRLFLFGDKARHFHRYRGTESSGRDWLTGINDTSPETLGVIFDRITSVLATEDIKQKQKLLKCCPEQFFSYFLDNRQRETFIDLITQQRPKSTLQLRDYFLFFLHTISSRRLGKASILVSTSTSWRIAQGFSAGDRGRNLTRLIIHYYVPQPYIHFIVSPWLASEHHKLAYTLNLPTYQSLGPYPKQCEVAVKGALFPHFIIGLENCNSSEFVVNPNILRVSNESFGDAVRFGFSVDQNEFKDSILSTGYSRYAETDLRGNFKQYDLPPE